MEKNRLCLVIPSLQAGGMERVMSELAGYFASGKDIEIHLVLYGITREVFYPIPESIIVHKPLFPFREKIRSISTVRTLMSLRKTIKTINPKTILSFGEYWNSFIMIALFGLNYPIFISDRCQPDKSLGRLHDWLRKHLYPMASGVIVQTEKAKEIYSSQLKLKNIEVIGNPIRHIASGGSSGRENIVLTVGRLIQTKHIDKLIELFIRISKPGWKLVIVGYDHLKQNISDTLLKIIQDNQAEDSVILAGKQTDVDAYYLKSKVFAFCSSSEGFPNVIGEAMAAGLPVVAFDCIAGPSEMIIDNHNGFLVPLFDYSKFQNNLKTLMEDENLRNKFGQRGKEDIKRFSTALIGEKYLQFILSDDHIKL